MLFLSLLSNLRSRPPEEKNVVDKKSLLLWDPLQRPKKNPRDKRRSAQNRDSHCSQYRGRSSTYERGSTRVLDEDVRPALQMDGGDVQLVKIEDNNICVVGAWYLSSSVMTMKWSGKPVARKISRSQRADRSSGRDGVLDIPCSPKTHVEAIIS